MKSLHIALFGCGRWGKFILRDLKQLNCIVTVICRQEKSIINAKTYQADNIISSFKHLPKQLDGIVIATPTSNHFQLITEVQHLNIPIFTEKPMATSIQEAQELLPLKNQLFVMDKFRYHGGIQKLRGIYQSKTLGKPLGLNTYVNRWGINHVDVDTLTVLLPHELSIMQEILDYIPTFQKAFKHKWYDDKSRYQLFFEDNIWVNCDINTYQSEPSRGITLVFEDGLAILENINSQEIKIISKEKEIQSIAFINHPPLYLELKAFLEFINGGTPPKSNVQDAFGQIAILDEVRKACE